MNAPKALMLGTAQWGWTAPAAEAFRLLDAWLARGYKGVDCATNYPINKCAADFRAAEKILQEYIRAHGLSDLDITMKVGSLDNMRTPDVLLSPSFLQMIAGEYHRLLGSNLRGLMLHWDNRESTEEIAASLHTLRRLQQELGIRPGLSGLKHPQIHAALAKQMELRLDLQMKHHLLHSDLPRYAVFSPEEHRFWVYGIHGGGLKLDGEHENAGSTFQIRGGNPDTVQPLLTRLQELLPQINSRPGRPPIHSMHQLAFIFAGMPTQIHGIVVGASRVEQLTENLDFHEQIGLYDYQEVYERLMQLR